MRTRRYLQRILQGILLACCMLIVSCLQIGIVNADEEVVSLDIELEDDGTPMDGVVFSMYRITDNIVPHYDGEELTFMPDFADCGYKTSVTTARELVALSRRLTIWIEDKNIQPTYTLVTDESGYCGMKGIPFGMYLIVPSSFEDYGPVVSSLVFLPGRDADGNLIYHNRIVPKHSIPEEDNPDTTSTPGQGNTTTPEETTTPNETRGTDEESTPEETTGPQESTSPQESTTPEESTRPSEEESSPYQPTGPEAPTTPSSGTSPETPTSTSTTVTSSTVPNETTVSSTTPPSSPRRILGIEDPTGRIGMMMVTAGVALMALAIVLIVRRELKK